MKTIKMYDYACRNEIKNDESCIINMGLAYYLLGSVDAVNAFHQQYPNAKLMFELKVENEDEILDEKIAFDAGADIVSVSGLADDKTLCEAQEIAEANHAALIMNLTGVKDVESRLEDADLFGIQYVLLPDGIKTAEDHYVIGGQYQIRKYSYTGKRMLQQISQI